MEYLVFAYPTKRLRISALYAQSLRRKRDYEILFLTRYKVEDYKKGYRLLSMQEVVNVSKIEEREGAKHQIEDGNRRIVIFQKLQRSLKEKSRDVGIKFARLSSLGFVDVYDSAAYKVKIERDSYVIETLLRGSIPNFEESRVNIFFEGTRDHSFGLPLLYLRNRLTNMRIFLLEFAESAEETILSIYNRESFKSSLLNQYKRKHYRKFQTQAYKSKLFFTVPQHMALKELKIETEFPWRVGTSQILDRVFYRNPASLKKLEEQNLLQNNMRFIGEPMSEIMLNEAGNHDYGIGTETRSSALISMPQILESPRDFPQLNESQMSALVHTFLDSLKSQFSQITISLHPKQKFGDYAHLIDGNKVQISSKSIYELLPKCQFFVCGSSTTFYLAWLVKKPTLVFLPQEDHTSKVWSERIGQEPWFAKIYRVNDFRSKNLKSLEESAQSYFLSDPYLDNIAVKHFNSSYSDRLFSEIDETWKNQT